MSLTSPELAEIIANTREFNKAEAARVETNGGVFLSIGERHALTTAGYTDEQIEAIAAGTFTE